MEEGSFDVELAKFPIEQGGNVRDGSKGFEVNSGGSSLVIVNAISLSEALHYILDFVVDDFSGAVMFVFTYEFSFDGWCPQGSLDWGTRMKTFNSCKLCNLLHLPAIQYSHSSDLIACAHRGSSSGLTVGSIEPSVSVDRTSSTEE